MITPRQMVALLPHINGDPIDVVVHHVTLGRGLMTLWPIMEHRCSDCDECDECDECDNPNPEGEEGCGDEEGAIWFKPDREGAEHILVGTIEHSSLCHCGHCLQIKPAEGVFDLFLGTSPFIGRA